MADKIEFEVVSHVDEFMDTGDIILEEKTNIKVNKYSKEVC